MKKLTILGATGSIGTQALDIVRESAEGTFSLVALTACHNVASLISLSLEFRPLVAVIADESLYSVLKDGLAGSGIRTAAGREALIEAAGMEEADIVLSTLVGSAGILPTLKAIEKGKTIALANKEVLVAAGVSVMEAARKYNARIVPVDSEHSAIYQCLVGEPTPPAKLLLTASGGPFRAHSEEQLQSVTPQQALVHPRWKMGPKVTIDSSTLANKGFEVIEAHHLFAIPPSKIQVVIHPESIVHSMVEFRDGQVKALLSPPDMRYPISYALYDGIRPTLSLPTLDWINLSLHFESPDLNRFPMLRMALEALRVGGNTPAIFNAADAVAVQAFTNGEIPFLGIANVTARVMELVPGVSSTDIDTILATDLSVTEVAQSVIRSLYYS